MSEPSKHTIPLHYWLASATVYYCESGKVAEGVTPAVVNVIFTTKEEKILSKDLTQAQRGAQQHLIQRMGPNAPTVDVVDVVFNSFTHLGYVSPVEFLGTTEEELQKGLAEGFAAANEAAQ